MTAGYAEALANFAPLIDDKTGIISSVEVLPVSEIDPQVFLAHASPCNTVPLTGIELSRSAAVVWLVRTPTFLR
jgi:hypothetical protein